MRADFLFQSKIMTNEYSLLSILNVLMSWKKTIILTVVVVGLLSAVFSFMQPNYYKAETVFYPASPTLADPAQLGYNNTPMYVYGGSDDLDRLFSIVTSEKMVSYLIKKFDLYKHYDQDSTSREGQHKMKELFKGNYKAIKSKYGALILSVEDKNPELAAAIANEARKKTEEFAQAFVKNAQLKSLESYRKNVNEQFRIMAILEDSIRQLKSRYNLIEANYQQRVFADELVTAIASKTEAASRAEYFSKYESKKDSTIKYRAFEKGYASKIVVLQSKIDEFNNHISRLLSVEQAYSRASDQSSIVKEKERLLQAAYDSPFTAIHLVDEAIVPEHKSRPKRSLIILLSMLIAFVASVTGVLMIHSYRQRLA
ncbi:MAG TPA: Wzz/FepE/Etk N-terminal domain-containing protein [Chitinophagaceae bacterium]|nr:Wzz/FepE/Etk N-terminal domain-containing protein [Chitinophagaceae bacterium]